GPLIAAVGLVGYTLVAGQLASLRSEAAAKQWLEVARHSAAEGQLDVALSQFTTARGLAEGDRRHYGLLAEIDKSYHRARDTKKIRDAADELFGDVDRLHFSLLGFSGDSQAARHLAQVALAKFSVPDDALWFRREPIALLDEPRRVRLLAEVNELLFL